MLQWLPRFSGRADRANGGALHMSGLTLRQKFNCSRGGGKVKVKVCFANSRTQFSVDCAFLFSVDEAREVLL